MIPKVYTGIEHELNLVLNTNADGDVCLDAVTQEGDRITTILVMSDDGLYMCLGAQGLLEEHGYDTSKFEWTPRGAIRPNV